MLVEVEETTVIVYAGRELARTPVLCQNPGAVERDFDDAAESEPHNNCDPTSPVSCTNSHTSAIPSTAFTFPTLPSTPTQTAKLHLALSPDATSVDHPTSVVHKDNLNTPVTDIEAATCVRPGMDVAAKDKNVIPLGRQIARTPLTSKLSGGSQNSSSCEQEDDDCQDHLADREDTASNTDVDDPEPAGRDDDVRRLGHEAGETKEKKCKTNCHESHEPSDSNDVFPKDDAKSKKLTQLMIEEAPGTKFLSPVIGKRNRRKIESSPRFFPLPLSPKRLNKPELKTTSEKSSSQSSESILKTDTDTEFDSDNNSEDSVDLNDIVLEPPSGFNSPLEVERSNTLSNAARVQACENNRAKSNNATFVMIHDAILPSTDSEVLDELAISPCAPADTPEQLPILKSNNLKTYKHVVQDKRKTYFVSAEDKNKRRTYFVLPENSVNPMTTDINESRETLLSKGLDASSALMSEESFVLNDESKMLSVRHVQQVSPSSEDHVSGQAPPPEQVLQFAASHRKLCSTVVRSKRRNGKKFAAVNIPGVNISSCEQQKTDRYIPKQTVDQTEREAASFEPTEGDNTEVTDSDAKENTLDQEDGISKPPQPGMHEAFNELEDDKFPQKSREVPSAAGSKRQNATFVVTAEEALPGDLPFLVVADSSAFDDSDSMFPSKYYKKRNASPAKESSSKLEAACPKIPSPTNENPSKFKKKVKNTQKRKETTEKIEDDPAISKGRTRRNAKMNPNINETSKKDLEMLSECETLDEKPKIINKRPGKKQRVFATDTKSVVGVDTEADTEPLFEADTEPLVDADTEPLVEADTEPLVEVDTEPLVEADTEPLVEADAEPLVPVSGKTRGLRRPCAVINYCETSLESTPNASADAGIKSNRKLAKKLALESKKVPTESTSDASQNLSSSSNHEEANIKETTKDSESFGSPQSGAKAEVVQKRKGARKAVKTGSPVEKVLQGRKPRRNKQPKENGSEEKIVKKVEEKVTREKPIDDLADSDDEPEVEVMPVRNLRKRGAVATASAAIVQTQEANFASSPDKKARKIRRRNENTNKIEAQEEVPLTAEASTVTTGERKARATQKGSRSKKTEAVKVSARRPVAAGKEDVSPSKGSQLNRSDSNNLFLSPVVEKKILRVSMGKRVSPESFSLPTSPAKKTRLAKASAKQEVAPVMDSKKATVKSRSVSKDKVAKAPAKRVIEKNAKSKSKPDVDASKAASSQSTRPSRSCKLKAMESLAAAAVDTSVN
ncbi:hypothetical protein HAZT_HAZT007165 [Hyalella azteca]|uniref:Uncharacterized protein n=1 Tax=Hyalella azteca TaxID=294128 RepID=A0A6A0GUA4_HYAAZ|nr:hypothetical protein HAZT_HAZT007165 [Hyalella azteca]